MRRLAQRHFILVATAALLASCDDPSSGSVVDVDASLASIAAGSQVAAASNVTATVVTDQRIDVRWSDNSDNETSFELHRSQAGPTGAFAVVATTSRNVVLHADVHVAPGTQYCYAIRAARLSGKQTAYATLSNVACVTIPTGDPAVPDAPSNLAAVATTSTQVDLAWTDNSAVETGFLIEHTRVGPYGPIIHTIATTAANVTAYRHATAQPATEYCYHIRAVNAVTTATGTRASYSAPSNTVCVTTPAPPPPPFPPPSAYVVSAKATSSSEIEITVAWTDPSPAPGFHTYRSTNGGASWELLGEGVLSDDGRAAEQSVCYRVVAYNGAGTAAPSNVSCATPTAAPTNLVATRLDVATARFTWSDNSNVEDAYEVWGRWSAGSCCPNQPGWCDAGAQEGEYLVATLPAGTTSYTRYASIQCGLVDYPFYSYYIVARKGTGVSSPSNEVSSPLR